MKIIDIAMIIQKFRVSCNKYGIFLNPTVFGV